MAKQYIYPSDTIHFNIHGADLSNSGKSTAIAIYDWHPDVGIPFVSGDIIYNDGTYYGGGSNYINQKNTSEQYSTWINVSGFNATNTTILVYSWSGYIGDYIPDNIQLTLNIKSNPIINNVGAQINAYVYNSTGSICASYSSAGFSVPIYSGTIDSDFNFNLSVNNDNKSSLRNDLALFQFSIYYNAENNDGGAYDLYFARFELDGWSESGLYGPTLFMSGYKPESFSGTTLLHTHGKKFFDNSYDCEEDEYSWCCSNGTFKNAVFRYNINPVNPWVGGGFGQDPLNVNITLSGVAQQLTTKFNDFFDTYNYFNYPNHCHPNGIPSGISGVSIVSPGGYSTIRTSAYMEGDITRFDIDTRTAKKTNYERILSHINYSVIPGTEEDINFLREVISGAVYSSGATPFIATESYEYLRVTRNGYYNGNIFNTVSGINYTLECDYRSDFTWLQVLLNFQNLDYDEWDYDNRYQMIQIVLNPQSGVGLFNDVSFNVVQSNIYMQSGTTYRRQGQGTYIDMKYYEPPLWRQSVPPNYSGQYPLTPTRELIFTINDYDRRSYLVNNFLINNNEEFNSGISNNGYFSGKIYSSSTYTTVRAYNETDLIANGCTWELTKEGTDCYPCTLYLESKPTLPYYDRCDLYLSGGHPRVDDETLLFIHGLAKYSGQTSLFISGDIPTIPDRKLNLFVKSIEPTKYSQNLSSYPRIFMKGTDGKQYNIFADENIGMYISGDFKSTNDYLNLYLFNYIPISGYSNDPKYNSLGLFFKSIEPIIYTQNINPLLFIKGSEGFEFNKSGEYNSCLYMSGFLKNLNSNLNLFIKNEDPPSGTISDYSNIILFGIQPIPYSSDVFIDPKLHIYGTEGVQNKESIDLILSGEFRYYNDIFNLYTYSYEAMSGYEYENMNLYVRTLEYKPYNSGFSLFLSNFNPSGNMNLYMFSESFSSGNMNLFIPNDQIGDNLSSINMYLVSYLEESGSIPLYIKGGGSAGMNIFIQADNAGVDSNIFNLNLYGSEIPSLFGYFDLKISGDATRESNINLWIAGNPETNEETSYFNLFMKNYNIDGSIPQYANCDFILYNNYESGSNNLDLYLQGNDYQNIIGNMNLYIGRDSEGTSDVFDMYLAGPSGYYSDATLYVQGKPNHRDSISLQISGMMVSGDFVRLYINGF